MVEKAYSTYYQELDEEAKARYREKLGMIGDIDDPYLKALLSIGSCGQRLSTQIYLTISLQLLASIRKINSKHTKAWMHIISI